METKRTQDLDMTGTPLAESQFSFAIQQNHKPQGTEPLPAQGQEKQTPHLSLGLWFPVCAMVLEIEEPLKTALAMRGGLGLPHELSNATCSCPGVTRALSTRLWEGTQKPAGASVYGFTFLQHFC